MGRVWDGPGRLLGALGRFLAAFWAFKIDLFSSMGPRWAPRGLLDRSRVDFGRVWEGFGRILRGLGTLLGRIWKDLGKNLIWTAIYKFLDKRLMEISAKLLWF